ncbi:MAG: hypothetical protein ABIG43_02645 [Chloroflexota bacterium]
MANHKIPITKEIKSVHIRSYGTLRIKGSETDEIKSSSSDYETLTVVQSGDIVYVTAMNSCDLELPMDLPVFVEKAMGSVHSEGLKNAFRSVKVLGSLIVDGARSVDVEKVGGNCAIRNIEEKVNIEKTGGNLVAESITSLRAEKTGGSCLLKDVKGEIQISKIGGSFSGQNIAGSLDISRVSGDYTCDRSAFGIVLKVGGDIQTKMTGELALSDIKAGGDIDLYLEPGTSNLSLSLGAGGDISVAIGDLDVQVENQVYEVALGTGEIPFSAKAGGDISIADEDWQVPEIVGDLSAYFEESGPALNEVIHEHVRRATQLAEKRIEAAQKRLEHIQAKIDIDFGDLGIPSILIPGMPKKASSPKAQKGASDEERLLILQMLQDKKITVEEAEALFSTLEK